MPSETKISFYDGSTSDSVRKLSDDLSRKHLSAGSSLSVTSMDALWEKHPRRLSEAGLRRSSDHSVVLTEDTDSFIIGERVWVGGTKPGQIAYIGETQFAPGDWAGIVLDEPIGKNDGSVAGVRYFQCADKRGVFSRLTRLTRTPLPTHDASPVSDAGSVFERPPSGIGRPRRTLSPNGSIRSVVSSKMNASITTTTSDVRIGDRVIASSSRGSKAGTLRFVGVTEFAPGVWAGVELDDPLGKNDGSVEGKRYFTCAPRFGLFAPISKVSRSPSNRKPGACAVHNNGRATPVRRSTSRESLVSLSTSVASSRPRLPAQRYGGPRASSTPVSAKNALQELLREKQQHLERAMKERELERAEVVKFTIQANRNEALAAQFKKDSEQREVENEKLKSQLDKLNKMLEDERQKVEDLMFRNEEENINKEDYNKYKEAMAKEKAEHEQRIRELEAEVTLQMARADATAATIRALEEQRATEVQAMVDQHKEELSAAQTLSSELQKLLDEAYALLKEKENEKDSIGKSLSDELSKLKSESERALNEARTKMAISQTEFDTQLSVITAKLQLAESKLEIEKQNVEKLSKDNSQTFIDLNAKLSQLQAIVDDKTQELNKVMGASKEHELNLSKDITKLKMELSAKVLDLEQLTDAMKKQDESCKKLQNEITQVKEDYTNKINEYETLLTEANQHNEQSKEEILNLHQSLSAKTKDYERLLNESNSTTLSSEKLINEYKETIHERDKEITRLKDEYEQVTANFNIKHSKIAEEHKKEIDARNNKIDELTKELKNQNVTLEQTKNKFDNLHSQFSTNENEIVALKEENELLKKTITDLTQVNNELKSRISSMELEIGELKRQLESTNEKCAELQKAKEKVESEYMHLTGQATDSNDQFIQLSQHLKETEKELESLQDKHRETVNTHGRIEQELKQKLFKLQEDFSVERSKLLKSMDENAGNINSSVTKIKAYEENIIELNSRVRDYETNVHRISDENASLKEDIEKLKLKENEITEEFINIRKKLESDIKKYKEEISLLKAEGATSEVKLMEKVDQLIETQNDLNNKLEEARKHEESLQRVVTEMTSKIEEQKRNYEKEITQIQTQLSLSNDDKNNLKTEEAKLRETIQEKENILKELKLQLEIIQVDLKSNLELVAEKDRQLSQLNEELNKSHESKQQVEDKLNNATLEKANLKQLYESLINNSSAEESLLKEQQNQLNTLNKEITVLSQDKSNIESKLIQLQDTFNNLKHTYEETVLKLKEEEGANIELKKSIEEKEQNLISHLEKSQIDLHKLQAFENELNKLKQEFENQSLILEGKDTQINQLNNLLETGANDSQLKMKQLQEEHLQLNNKYKIDTENLSSNHRDLQIQLAEREKEIQDLKLSKDKVIELQELLSKAESDIKQLSSISEGQKANYEDLIKQLKNQYEDLKKDSKADRHELKAGLVEYEKQLNEANEKIATEVDKQKVTQLKLEESEKCNVELINKLELMSAQQSNNVEKDDKLQNLTLEMQALRKSSSEALANSENVIMTLKADVERNLKDLKEKEDFINKLQDEIRNQKAKAEISEREKVMLKKELDKSKEGLIKDKNDNSALSCGGGDTQRNSDVEVEGQVSFLNSVIVDMQRKNEQLMARVQALEGGSIEQETNPFALRKTRTIAPRLFCDICDVFDAHDTDECPRQQTHSDPAPASAHKKPPPPPRKYCDICEVFGHSTEDCDEEETF